MTTLDKADLDKINAMIDSKTNSLQLLLEGEFALTQLSQFNPPKNSIPRTSIFNLQSILDSINANLSFSPIDKTSERVMNGVYQNTDKAILFLTVIVNQTTTLVSDIAEVLFNIGLSPIDLHSQLEIGDLFYSSVVNGSNVNTLFFAIPQGYYYQLENVDSGGVSSIATWFEY